MNLNLGRIFLIVLFPILLFAKVSINVPDSFYKGDDVVFSITASGSNIDFPDIKNIDGFSVQNAGTSSQTSIINGVRKENLTRSFVFRPAKSVTIPSFDIKVDGRIVKTNSKKIEVLKVSKTVSPYYSLDISVDKKDVYVGEGIKFKLKFRYRKDLQIVDLQFKEPVFENFWVKELKGDKRKNNSSKYSEQELSFLLFPQKSGEIIIDPLKIGVVVMDSRYGSYGFFSSANTKTIPVYSNSLKLNVKPLPDGIKLIGDFEISSTIDKNEVEAGEAVSFKITIKGRGNIDDIDEVKLNIPNATIYENPAKKEYDIRNGEYGGIYTKTYSIVPSSNIILESIPLNFFDKKTASIKTLQSKSYNIKIKNIVVNKKPKLETYQAKDQELNKENKTVISSKTSDREKIIFFLLGALSTLVVFSIIYFYKNRTKQNIEKPFEKMIKGVKTPKELLNLLVVYINIDKELDRIIFNLEKSGNNIDIKAVKKEILQIIKDKKLDI